MKVTVKENMTSETPRFPSLRIGKNSGRLYIFLDESRALQFSDNFISENSGLTLSDINYRPFKGTVTIEV